MIETEVFCTEGTPAPNRARLFQDKMGSLFSMDLAISATEQHPLQTQMVAYSSSRLNFASLRFSPHSTSFVRKPQPMAPRLLVTLQKEGVATVTQDGRESRVEAGDFFVLDPTRPFHIETGEIRTHSIYLQRATMRELIPHIDSLTALTMKGHGGTGALFRAILDELFVLAPHLNDEMADRIADTIPHVLATALSSLDKANDIAPTRLKLFHKDRIRKYILDNISDPQLDVDMIATAANLSPRYIYQLFEDESVTLMKWVWNKRLDNCRKEIESPMFKNRTIGEIAYSWGFSDVAHFSRAFKERFTLSPRECRKEAQKKCGSCAVRSEGKCLQCESAES